MNKVTGFVWCMLLFLSHANGQIQMQMGARSPAPPTQSAFICNTAFEPLFRHKPIQSKAAWESQWPAIRSDFQKYVYGTFPEKNPLIRISNSAVLS